jgi:3-methyl-2-oxobutanoate hydroxymethyltransferase
MKNVTAPALRRMKKAGEKITCLTAYDYSFAALLDATGLDMVMVGDSLGMVVQGHETTLPVSLDDMVYHTANVTRGAKRAFVIADLPFGSYQQSPEQAFESAACLVGEGGAQCVKLEGGEIMAATVRFLATRGVSVCAHIGLQPQSVHRLGGYRVQGSDAQEAERLFQDAVALEDAGADLIVLESIPSELARRITQRLAIPTIGIGAGPHCDGQVLVLYDMLGIYPRPAPKFSKNFLEDAHGVRDAVERYVRAVRAGAFPSSEQGVVSE